MNTGHNPTEKDSAVPAHPLRHVQFYHLPESLHLKEGGQLDSVTVAYETYGQLNQEKDNAVLVCHAITGDSHVARHDQNDAPGWWDKLVGPGKSIDTDHYFVICSNILGGCRGTTGPTSADPATGQPYGSDFPVITVQDMVDVQHQLIDSLGIDKLRAVVGGSLGGQQTLIWATRYPDRVATALALATSPRLTSQALAFDIVARNAIMRDHEFHSGKYYDQSQSPDVGLALARMIGHITYLSHESMTAKFDPNRFEPRDIATEFEKKFSVGSYLAYQGHKFVKRFDANSYITLSMAMDLFNIGETEKQLTEILSRSTCRWLVTSFSSDWLFPPFQSRKIVAALIRAGKSVSYCNIISDAGHDAFLLDKDLGRYGQLICGMLDNAIGQVSTIKSQLVNDDSVKSQSNLEGADKNQQVAGLPRADDPTSIYHARRMDYDLILDLIPENASVLDVGCGQGGLLSRIKQRDCQRTSGRVMGIELDEESIVTNVLRGLDVVQYNLNQGNLPFIDKQFDVVLLSQTLQAVSDVQTTIDEVLRIGNKCIVSFPNMAHHRFRNILGEVGRAPVAVGHPRYRWYDTPNIRFFTIADFDHFCKHRNIQIHKTVYLDNQSGEQIEKDPNLNADTAIYVISKA